MLRGFTYIIIFLYCSVAAGQDIEYARNTIDILASPAFQGRGYVKKGDSRAGTFIAAEFFRFGLRSFGTSYYQHYSFPINTLPSDLVLNIAGHRLKPGEDYVISAFTPTLKGRFRLIWDADSTGYPGDEKSFIVSDKSYEELEKNFPYQAAGAISIVDPADNLWWHISGGGEVKDYALLKIKAGMIIPGDQEIYLNVKTKFIDNYRTSNVVGWIRGAAEPDSFIVISAHYDHLGMMGNQTYFPGANDNASGVAMLLDLVRHYTRDDVEPPPVSLVFIAFSGEEAGLKGSRHFADNPLFPLKRIKAMINLDMIGSGSQGITIVNGHELTGISRAFEEINNEMKLVRYVTRRSAACNSDHCPFYEKGVPAVFIYTSGKEYSEYHNVWDRAPDVPLTAYEELFVLLTEFIRRY